MNRFQIPKTLPTSSITNPDLNYNENEGGKDSQNDILLSNLALNNISSPKINTPSIKTPDQIDTEIKNSIEIKNNIQNQIDIVKFIFKK